MFITIMYLSPDLLFKQRASPSVSKSVVTLNVTTYNSEIKDRTKNRVNYSMFIS